MSKKRKKRSRARKRAERKEKETFNGMPDSGGSFAYVAGYTENGVLFGVTWEEWREIENEP